MKQESQSGEIRKLLVISLCVLSAVFMTGCKTYFGYETTTVTEDIPNSVKKVDKKLAFRGYQVEFKRFPPHSALITVAADVDVSYSKQIKVFEKREHIYLDDNWWRKGGLIGVLILVPIRCIGDCFLVYAPWHLASNPPSLIRRITYIPPFSWIAIFQMPPYWLNDPQHYEEGKNTTYGADGSEMGTKSKTIETEKIFLRQEKVIFTRGETRRINVKNIAIKVKDSEQKDPHYVHKIIVFKDEGNVLRDGWFLNPEHLSKDFWLRDTVDVTVSIGKYSKELQIPSEYFLDKEECYKIAQQYLKTDFSKAVKFFRFAADEGHPYAQFDLWNYYCSKKEYETAFSWLKKSAQSGCPLAQNVLAVLVYCKKHENSPSINPFILGEHYYSLLYRQNHICHKNGTVESYVSMQNPHFDMETIKYFSKIIDADKTDFIKNITDKKYHGYEDLFKTASENGSLEASYNLGLCYLGPFTSEDSKAKAKELLIKTAQCNIGNALEILINKCDLSADELYPFAVKGYAPAGAKLGDMYNDCHKIPCSQSELERMLLKASNTGNAAAQYQLGRFYLYNKNFEEAYKLLSKVPKEMIAQSVQRRLDFCKKYVFSESAAAPYITRLKNSKMLGFPGTTIGKAFDSYFINPQWYVYELKNGTKLVLFLGQKEQNFSNADCEYHFLIADGWIKIVERSGPDLESIYGVRSTLW